MNALLSVRRQLAAASLLIGTAALAQVPFVGETERIPTATAGDLAIVVDVANPLREPLIAAGDPIQNGLYFFSLDGGFLQVVPYGAMRGVDARSNLRLPTAPETIIAASAAITQEVVFGAPTATGIVDVTSSPVAIPTASALAMRRMLDGGAQVVVDDSSGRLRHFELTDDLGARVGGAHLGTFQLPGVPSALVIDDRTGILYAAIPAQGIFRVELDVGLVDNLVPMDGGGFNGNIAGLTFYPLGDGGGLLLTTVPALDDVTVHALLGNNFAFFVTRFTVEVGNEVVRNSRHVDVVPNRLPGFDAGLFVIHDGLTANYKLVPWELLANSTSIPLPVEVPEDLPATVDGGTDGGTDGGLVDGGLTDGGLTDGGNPGTGGGGGPVTGGGPGSVEPDPSGCHCSTVDLMVFPALWGLWLFARSRRRRMNDA